MVVQEVVVEVDPVDMVLRELVLMEIHIPVDLPRAQLLDAQDVLLDILELAFIYQIVHILEVASPDIELIVAEHFILILVILLVVMVVMEVMVRDMVRQEPMVVVEEVVVHQIVVVLLQQIHNMVEPEELVVMGVIGDLMVVVVLMVIILLSLQVEVEGVLVLLVLLLQGRIISLIQTQLLPHSEVLDSNSYF
jgi:hypothetical protein